MLDWQWENPYTYIFGEDCPKSQFDADIGKAVFTIWKKNEEDFETCYIELRKGGINDKEAFSKCAVSAADSYFSKGYGPGSFLGYCAIVLGVATFYYEYPPNGVPETAVEVIALVLFAHQLTGQFYKHDGWDGLRKTSRLFNAVSETTCNKVSERQNRV
ncbi:hypothetical protein AVEN_95380-1 [Araneus ventricosus]|uniref:Uncharacterized protein n=1 Tax=Araneus ventricosus TaxID=182803 RepID=A0A4Y2CIB4_ARAVE|nr:hypothetical protein AVEN_95380-1 [Araneus ventricosus]